MLEINRYARLERLPESYRELFQRAGAQSFFFTQPWFRNFGETVVGPGDTMRIYGVERPESELAVAGLLMWKRNNSRRFLSPVVFEGLSNYYTCLFGPVVGTAGPINTRSPRR